MPEPATAGSGAAPLGLVTLGGCDAAAREALEQLAERGIEMDYLRVRGFPFHPSVAEFLESHEQCFVAEQNRDGQLRSLLILEAGADPETVHSVRYFGGSPMSAAHVVDGVLTHLFKQGVEPVGTAPAHTGESS